MLEEIHEYIENSVVLWTLGTHRVDHSYDVKTKVNKDKSGKDSVGVYKVGEPVDSGDNIWQFVFSITPTNSGFYIGFFLDTENDIMESLDKANIEYSRNTFMREYKVVLSNFEEVKNFLNQHVWCHDLGYFY